MAAQVGAVEAVLSAKDIMTPVMVDAARAVKGLQDRIKELGETSGAEFDTLSARLAAAQDHFNELAALNQGAVQQALARTQTAFQQSAVNAQTLGTAVASTNTAMTAMPAATAAATAAQASLNTATAATGQTMGQVEGIAARLITRLLILYAVRGTFEFVIGLYEAADALVKTSNALDISIHDLQVYGNMAEQTGIPVNKMTSAIDHFNKTLVDGKLTTEDTLESIGLSISKISDLNQSDRISVVLTAIGQIPDKLARTKAEVALFGTDAIDPLSKSFEALHKSAEDSNKIISDDTARTMSMAATAYKEAWDKMKKIATEGYAATIEAAGKLFSGQGGVPGMGGEGLPGGAGEDNPSTGGGHDQFLPKDLHAIGFVAGDVTNGEFFQDYIDKLRAASSGVKELTDEQVKQLMELKDLNLLTADNAAQLTKDGVNLDINTAKYKQFLELEKAREAGIKAQQTATENYNRALFNLDSIGNSWKATLDEMDGKEVESIKWAMAGGVAHKDLAIIYEATAAQINAVAKSLAADTKEKQINAAATLEITKLADELNKIVGDQGTTSFQQQEAAIDKWAADLTARMSKAGTDTDEFYDMLAATVTAKYKQIGVDWKSINDTLTKDSKASLQQTADVAKATFQEALKHIGEMTPEAIQHFRDVADAAQKAADEWGTSVTANAAKAADATAASANSQLTSINAVTQGYYAQIDAAAKAAAAASNGLESVTGHRPPHLENGIWVDDNGPINTSNPTGFVLPGFKLPGFEKGGVVTVGEFGAEQVALPDGATVFPHGSSSGGDVHVTVAMKVSGVLDPATIRTLTSETSKQIIKEAKQALQYGSR